MPWKQVACQPSDPANSAAIVCVSSVFSPQPGSYSSSDAQEDAYKPQKTISLDCSFPAQNGVDFDSRALWNSH